MKRSLRNWLAVGLAMLVVACLAVSFFTRDSGAGRAVAKAPAAGAAPAIDQKQYETARLLVAGAETAEEQSLAGQALRLADHELDQAFATALREAAAAPPPTGGPWKQIADRIGRLRAKIAAGQDRIAQLTKQAPTHAEAADQLELAKAQMALDQDELDDAQQELVKRGGDRHARLQQVLEQHEAAQKAASQSIKPAPVPETATLGQQVTVWFALQERQGALQAAAQQAARKATALDREHDTLENLLNHKVPVGPVPPSDEEEDSDDTAAMLARLRQLSDQRKTLAELDKRVQDSQQLAEVYRQWGAVLGERQRGLLHRLMRLLAAVFGILLAVVLLNRGIHRAFGHHTDRRRLHQLRLLASLGVQAAGLVLILLVIFGIPTQTPTIIGLTTAGLTVVLKDFIVAFFGWFVLMGRNGLRIGDWVEIQGVSGEVVEIGLLRTVLLEMGNWTGTGHPTGRRVAFVNSFAIEGHYFNFSTAGQWLWDVLQISLPAAGDPYEWAEQIRQTVERETEAEAGLAEQDWGRVTSQYGMRPFTAKPAAELRPSATGVDVVVRYIARAPRRYEVKSRLFQAIVELLHKPVAAGKAEA